jgi:hypothetical protein
MLPMRESREQSVRCGKKSAMPTLGGNASFAVTFKQIPNQIDGL